MDTAPVYYTPVLAQYENAINFSYWETVTKTYEEGRFKDAIIAVLNYVNPQLAQMTGNADQTRFVIPHGSIVVYLDIDEQGFNITAPFLKLPETNLIPLLRQISEINFGTLVLSQIVLKGDELHFQYSGAIDTCEPFKLYRIFEEMCVYADEFDDTFIEKFGAVRIAEMQVDAFAPDVLDQAYSIFQACLNEGLELLNYYEGKRYFGFGWDALYLAMTKIDYVMQPQGYLRTEMDKALRLLNGDTPINDRLNKTRAAFQKFLTMDKAKFAESMYRIRMFISSKTKADLNWLRSEYFGERYKNAKAEIDASNFNGGALTLLVGLYGLFRNYHIPPEVYTRLSTALEQSAGKPWNEAANILRASIEEVLSVS